MNSKAPSKTLKLIAEHIKKNRKPLWNWLLKNTAQSPPPFYCSVDLRDSGHKIVPVDSNLYPGGFNNICPEDLRAAPPSFRAQLDAALASTQQSQIKKILIIPENHTSNTYYIENVYYLSQIIEDAGYEVRLGWYPTGDSTSPQDPISLTSFTGKNLTAYPIRKEGNRIQIEGFIPDCILINNDFSVGYPKLLDSLDQPVLPSHTLGWHSRKKSTHFKHYNQLALEFAEIIGIDPWLIQIESQEVGPVNFNEGLGIEEVANAVDKILTKTQTHYNERNIHRKSFAFVKNNAGTYGMGILVAHSADEVRNMNRRTKNKMSVGKNRLPIGSVVVQEGIPTATLVDRLAAEPVIYLFGSELIGGFLRTNTEKGDEENLNSQGMVFKKLCMSDLRKPNPELEEDEEQEEEPLLELVYGSIARISALATGRELLERN